MNLLSGLGIGNPFAGPIPSSAKTQAAKALQGVTQKSLAVTKIPAIPRPSDFPGGFKIYEIVSGKVPADPTISLIENRMPKVPFEFGGEQRIVKDYYPGNSEPVMHVLGPKETDVILSGRFYDKKFKSSLTPSQAASGVFKDDNYGASYALASVIDGIRLRGNLCKFQMGQWVRYGFLSKTAFPMKRLGDIEYHITLDISGFNLPKNAYFTNPKQAPFAKNEALVNLTQAHSAAYTFTANLSKEQATVKANAPTSIIDDLNSAVGSVATQISKVTGFVDSVFAAGTNLLAVANRALGLIKNAQRALSQYKRELATIQNTFRTLTPLNQPPHSTASGQVIVNQHIMQQNHDSHTMSAMLLSMQIDIQAISQTIPLSRVRVNATDTLQKIAAKQYGNANLWTTIYDHNNLSSTQLTPGQILEIPKQ
jgi:hypothetical protein